MSGTALPLDAIEIDWQEQHTDHPGMEKSTYVRNCLFNGKFSISDLGKWVLDQDDLPDQVWSGGSDGYFAFIESDGEDGKKFFKADPNGPRVVVRVQMETMRNGGESKLLKSERSSWQDWDD